MARSDDLILFELVKCLVDDLTGVVPNIRFVLTGIENEGAKVARTDRYQVTVQVRKQVRLFGEEYGGYSRFTGIANHRGRLASFTDTGLIANDNSLIQAFDVVDRQGYRVNLFGTQGVAQMRFRRIAKLFPHVVVHVPNPRFEPEQGRRCVCGHGVGGFDVEPVA